MAHSAIGAWCYSCNAPGKRHRCHNCQSRACCCSSGVDCSSADSRDWNPRTQARSSRRTSQGPARVLWIARAATWRGSCHSSSRHSSLPGALAVMSMLPFSVQLSIDEILQNAHDFNPRKAMTVDLRPAVEALFRELEEKGVDHVLVGGVALLSYVEGRNTQDIDLIVKAEDAAAIDWNAKVVDRDFGQASYRGVRVDLLLRTNPVFDYVAEHERTRADFHGRRVPIATRKGLLLLKLYALPSLYRNGQLARAALYETDVRMLHQGADIDDGELLSRLEAHLSRSDIAELSRILDDQRANRPF